MSQGVKQHPKQQTVGLCCGQG